MTLKNKLWNWLHGVKRYKAKGCKNCGVITRFDKVRWPIVKFDWSKPVVYQSPMYNLSKQKTYPKIISIKYCTENYRKESV